MRCSRCNSDDVVFARSYEGTAFCARCFKRNIEERVRRTISKYSMLKPDDHVAVAVSGGKDSLTLLTILSKIEKKFPKARLTAITVDEGISGYREESLKLARARCAELGIEQVTVSFRELFGVTTDGLAVKLKEIAPCSYCGVLRRKAINKAAQLIGATKIATAHNLDDELQTAVMNILQGDIDRLLRAAPTLEDPRGRFITRIKPLCEIPEREVALYAYLSGFEFQGIPCPYAPRAFRSDVREALNLLEQKRPGLKIMAYRSFERLKGYVTKPSIVDLGPCELCGDPTPNKICEGCRMLKDFIGVIMPSTTV